MKFDTGYAIGFTGTRQGMTNAQYQKVGQIVNSLAVNEAHHGDCVGADAQFHEICAKAGIEIIGHPATDSNQRAFCKGFSEVREAKPPLERNRDIVEESDAMIATPSGFKEQWRGSGTWATVRYSRSDNKPLFIVYPNGSVSSEHI